jgi:hypothetical protein
MASFVLTKDRVYWSKLTDSHEDIIREHNLSPDSTHDPNILRVEIAPPDGNYALPPDQWIYRVDHDIRPPWADDTADEKRTRLALAEWYAAGIVPPGTVADVVSGKVKAVLGQVDRVWGSVNEVCGGGYVNVVRDGGYVNRVWDGGYVNRVWEGGSVNVVQKGGSVNEVREGGSVNVVRGLVSFYGKPANPYKIEDAGIVILRHENKIVVADKSLKLVRRPAKRKG